MASQPDHTEHERPPDQGEEMPRYEYLTDKTGQDTSDEQDDPWDDPAVQERLRYIYNRGYRLSRPGYWPHQIGIRESLAHRLHSNPQSIVRAVIVGVVILTIGVTLAFLLD